MRKGPVPRAHSSPRLSLYSTLQLSKTYSPSLSLLNSPTLQNLLPVSLSTLFTSLPLLPVLNGALQRHRYS
ncbi:MAG: hypothetical protein [Microvirus sp.]|nr:MAG: hypothetical protein [Microvirus sp.]